MSDSLRGSSGWSDQIHSSHPATSSWRGLSTCTRTWRYVSISLCCQTVELTPLIFCMSFQPFCVYFKFKFTIKGFYKLELFLQRERHYSRVAGSKAVLCGGDQDWRRRWRERVPLGTPSCCPFQAKMQLSMTSTSPLNLACCLNSWR